MAKAKATKKKGATKRKAHPLKRAFNPAITFVQRWYPIGIILAAVIIIILLS